MRALLVLAVFAGGCMEVSFEDLEQTDVWYQEPTDQVDILWVVDDSSSMLAEQQTLATGFQSFALELENTGTDFHLGVITTTFLYDDPHRGELVGEPPFITTEDEYLTMFPSRVEEEVGISGYGREKGLEAASWALSPLLTTGTGANVGFLRPEAHLLVVFVSDEDDCSDEGGLDEHTANTACYRYADDLVPTAEFVADLRGLKPADGYSRVKLAAIVGPELTSGCLDVVPGTRYIEAARLTGGLVGDICQSDWSGILYDLGLNAVGIHTTFELSHGAAVDSMEVRVDDVLVPAGEEGGWTYDPEYYTVSFHGEWVPARGAVIEATYKVLPGS